VDVRSLFGAERHDLLELLRSLDGAAWTTPTTLPRWQVKDVALHLLDDDLGALSRQRDGDMSGLLDHTVGERAFVAALDQKNQRWVDAAHGLSRRVVCDLLEWSGEQVSEHHADVDLRAPAWVTWASDEPVPAWLDLARELTERWVHQQQIRDALERPSVEHAHLLDVVLRTFVWAFPHQYRPQAPEGTTLGLDLGEGRTWTLTCRGPAWELDDGWPQAPTASVVATGDAAWRWLTGGEARSGSIACGGDLALTEAALQVRSVLV
jgi:uncharacterized protein (TIGR03083 family)